MGIYTRTVYTYTCDRCDNKAEGADIPSEMCGTWSNVNGQAVGGAPIFGGGYKVMLCDKCTTTLAEWMEFKNRELT